MGGALTYSVVRTGKEGHGVPAQRGDTFWVVLSDSESPIPLRVTLPRGREAMALFSGEEEARMFCSLREEGEANPHHRETSVGEVISLLYRLTAARHVALDPLPEVLRGGLLGLITLDRERFARSFRSFESPQAASTNTSVSLSVSDPIVPSPIHSKKPRGIEITTLSPPVSRPRASMVAMTSSNEVLLWT